MQSVWDSCSHSSSSAGTNKLVVHIFPESMIHVKNRKSFVSILSLPHITTISFAASHRCWRRNSKELVHTYMFINTKQYLRIVNSAIITIFEPKPELVTSNSSNIVLFFYICTVLMVQLTTQKRIHDICHWNFASSYTTVSMLSTISQYICTH